jgi:hypothetical protein
MFTQSAGNTVIPILNPFRTMYNLGFPLHNPNLGFPLHNTSDTDADAALQPVTAAAHVPSMTPLPPKGVLQRPKKERKKGAGEASPNIHVDAM